MPHPSSTQVGKFTVALVVLLAVSMLSGAQASVARERALVRGQEREIDESIGALIRSKRDTTRFLIVHRALADSIARSARVRFVGPVSLSDLRITADSGRVEWTTGRRYSHPSAPGVRVRVRGRVRVPPTATASRATLFIALPGLSAKAASIDETPMLGNMWLEVGDSTDMRSFTIYDSRSAADRVILAWRALCGLSFALTIRCLWRGVRSVIGRSS